MKREATAAVLAALLTMSGFSIAGAAPWQGWRGSGGWGMGGQYQRIYDPAKLETVAGEVVAVEKTAPMKRMNSGIHLTLRTDKETVPVHLGPSWYIERLDARIEKGDRIEVTGSRVAIGGKPAIIAAEVRKGEERLKLRDENGVPAWAGWKR